MKRQSRMVAVILSAWLGSSIGWPSLVRAGDDAPMPTGTVALKNADSAISYPWGTVEGWPRYLVLEDVIVELVRGTQEAERLRTALDARLLLAEQECQMRVSDAVSACQVAVQAAAASAVQAAGDRPSWGATLGLAAAVLVVGAVVGVVFGVYVF